MRAQLLLLLTFAALHTVTLSQTNWKQCVWKKGDGRDVGLIKNCTFLKKQEGTSLRVLYSGSLRILGCIKCCKRWFFTFDGVECSGPMPIDGIVFMQVSGEQPLRVRQIEGYCENIPKGQVSVGFNVGNCPGYGNADAYSGWNSVSRIVVEEVPIPQQTPLSNWKQCVWKAGDGRDVGLIKDCAFLKKQEKTSLRVFYSGSLRILGCTKCCKRWFFTFNGVECSGPMPIDGIVYMQVSGEQPLRVRQIEGYCENIPNGEVRVGFNVGNCPGYGNADAYSGWNSVSRIVIEEVPARQP